MVHLPFLTLLSDFGLQDAYVGVMKGAIAQINPQVRVIDLTHQIPPQNVTAARFCLMTAYPYFPDGTVHVAVVDPGVGSTRRAIAVQLPNGFLVGPDNGLLGGVLDQYPAIAAVELTNRDYWRTANPSHTFHGRDVFAPVGAHLARGIPLAELGRAIALNSLMQLPLPSSAPTPTGIQGCIQHIDHFGNLITNIPGHQVQNQSWWVDAGSIHIPGQTTYADVPLGKQVALVGSHGWVEIAINGGNAHAKLHLQVGSPIQVML